MTLPGSEAPSIDADSWINSEPVSIGSGTYLLDFWSYSCKSCLEGTEIMKEIHEKYPDLTVIGVHAAELGFEKQIENVRKAVEDLEISYPVVFDPEKQVWESYSNSYWPGSVLIHNGDIVWRDMNSSFVQLEEKLSEILGVENPDFSTSQGGEERSASPDTYLGFRRCRGVNEEGNFRGEREFSVPEDRRIDSVYLDGKWRQDEEYIEAGEDAKLFFHFRGSRAYIVADPNDGIRDVDVMVDGEKVDHSDAGEDLKVEDRSFLRVRNPGLFSVIDSMHSRSELILEPERGTRIYSLEFE